jgi:Predicted metal-dependent hydrolase of the TIM-barrel fold
MYEYFDWGNRKPAIEMSQVANDEYAQICAKHPERFRMFASIPMMDADQACKELERARRFPGFSGITLCTHIRERALDETEFATFFAYANASGLACFFILWSGPCPKSGMFTVSITSLGYRWIRPLRYRDSRWGVSSTNIQTSKSSLPTSAEPSLF